MGRRKMTTNTKLTAFQQALDARMRLVAQLIANKGQSVERKQYGSYRVLPGKF